MSAWACLPSLSPMMVSSPSCAGLLPCNHYLHMIVCWPTGDNHSDKNETDDDWDWKNDNKDHDCDDEEYDDDKEEGRCYWKCVKVCKKKPHHSTTTPKETTTTMKQTTSTTTQECPKETTTTKKHTTSTTTEDAPGRPARRPRSSPRRPRLKSAPGRPPLYQEAHHVDHYPGVPEGDHLDQAALRRRRLQALSGQAQHATSSTTITSPALSAAAANKSAVVTAAGTCA